MLRRLFGGRKLVSRGSSAPTIPHGRTIAFNNIIAGDNIVTSDVSVIESSDTKEYRINFSFNREISPHDDLIALAFSTFCIKKYDKVAIDIPISDDVASKIVYYLGSELISRPGKPRDNISRHGIMLNFSGGFDSLAARELLPDNHNLSSIDFGAHFSRERKFFSKFDPLIMETNLAQTDLRAGQWAFMGIPTLLAADKFQAKYISFGSILEAGADNFNVCPIAARVEAFPPFAAAGLSNAPYVAGLTEIGTVMILGRRIPELVGESLISCASERDEKRYRKQVLAQIAEDRFGFNFNLDLVGVPAKKHYKFGQSLAADFLSFYITKFAGEDIASHTIDDIPDEVRTMARDMSLTFFERMNTNFYTKFPQELKGGLYSRLIECGIDPYNHSDWLEYSKISSFLSKYYKAIKPSQ